MRFRRPAVVLAIFFHSFAAPAVAQLCAGDCNKDGSVTVDELVVGLDIALGTGTAECRFIDADCDRSVDIVDLVGAVGSALDGCPVSDGILRINHMQVLGTHNSYHIQPQEPLFSAIADFSLLIAQSFEYTHIPLDEQFESQGIRQIELDVFADPEGGLYANRDGVRILTGDGASGIPELDLPGLKVLHVQDIDFESTCWTFADCLETLKAWSDSHPGHVPITVLVEAKDDDLGEIPSVGLTFAVPVPFGAEELASIDDEILQVFPLERIITPDDVRGDRETLREAIEKDGWPTLDESRGKVLFALDNGGAEKAAYSEGHPSLRGRIMFTSSEPPEAEAAFVKLNGPVGAFDRIQDLVACGYIIRTRADAPEDMQGRTGDTMQRDAAIASGAQFVSTDYPVPNPDFGSGYQVTIPMGMPARCNPISAPPDCMSLDIEDPDLLVGAARAPRS
jgi:hypothetical protein